MPHGTSINLYISKIKYVSKNMNYNMNKLYDLHYSRTGRTACSACTLILNTRNKLNMYFKCKLNFIPIKTSIYIRKNY